MSRYLRLVRMTLKPGTRARAEQLADRAAGQFHQIPGFEPGSAFFFVNEEEHTFGAISIWGSREAAVKTGEAMEPATVQALRDALDGALEASIYDVYELK